MRWWLCAVLFCGLACTRHRDAATEPTPPVPVIKDGGTERPARLIFGMAPVLGEADTLREYRPLVEYVGRHVGIPIEVRLSNSYAAVPKMLADFDIHLAILPPFTYVEAKRDNPGLILLATQIVDGSSTYAAYIITRDDSGIETLDDLRGKRFAFVDRHSTSGYLYPLAYLRSLGLEPDSFFGSVTFGGDHAQVIDMVLSRKVDAGATYSTAYKIDSVNRVDGKRLRILAKTGRIPLDAYCASPRLDRDLVQKVRNTLLGLSTRTEEGRTVLRGLTSINGFVAVGDDHYDEVRRVARLVEDRP